jgi:hypothetical protein
LSGSLVINSSWSEPANTSSAQDRVSDNMRSAQDAEPWSQPANTSSAQDRVPAKKRPAQDFLSADSSSVEDGNWISFQGDQQEVGTSSSSSHMVSHSPATLPANMVIRTPATLPAGDSRFFFRRKQRIYVCDKCGSSNGFKKQSLPYDGTFLHRNWKEGIEPHQLETMYLMVTLMLPGGAQSVWREVRALPNSQCDGPTVCTKSPIVKSALGVEDPELSSSRSVSPCI